jgi:hypothetical protein
VEKDKKRALSEIEVRSFGIFDASELAKEQQEVLEEETDCPSSAPCIVDMHFGQEGEKKARCGVGSKSRI